MALTFSHNAAKHRFEASSDGTLAGFLVFSEKDGVLALTHTETLAGFEGQGVGSFLAKGALEEARRQGQRVMPGCDFVAAYLRKHPEYADLQKQGPR